MSKQRLLLCSLVITHQAPVPFGTQIEKCSDCKMPIYIAPSTYANMKTFEFKKICDECFPKYNNLKFGGLMRGQKTEILSCLKKMNPNKNQN